VGFCKVEVVQSPKFQDHEIIFPPTIFDVSVKVIVSSAAGFNGV